MSDQPPPTPQQPPPPPQPQTVVNVNMANTNTAVAEATAAAKATPREWVPPVRKRTGKSILLAYLFFLITGPVAWHRIYLGRPATRVWLFLFWSLIGVALLAPAPLVLLGAAALLALDCVEIPRWHRTYDPDDALAATSRGPVRRPPLLRGLGWRRTEAPDRDPVQPTADDRHPPPLQPAPRPSAAAEERHPQPKPDLRTLLLREAHRGDGKLTVTQAVMATGQDWERVEGCLRDMVQAGYVDVDNEPHSGVIVYVFPELVGRTATPVEDE